MIDGGGGGESPEGDAGRRSAVRRLLCVLGAWRSDKFVGKNWKNKNEFGMSQLGQMAR